MNAVRIPVSPNAHTKQRRDAQLQSLIEAAELSIARGGLPALRARELSQSIGVALGALYNLVPDMDTLTMHVASRTLARMENAVMASNPRGAHEATTDPVARLVNFAHAYRRFATENMQLWRALFEFRMKPDRDTPAFLIEDQMRLFGHVSAALRPLAPAARDDELFLLSRTLFGAVHGVVLLGLEEKLAAMTSASVDRQLAWLVTSFCAGLDDAFSASRTT